MNLKVYTAVRLPISLTDFGEVGPAQHARVGLQGIDDAVGCSNVDCVAIYKRRIEDLPGDGVVPEQGAVGGAQGIDGTTGLGQIGYSIGYQDVVSKGPSGIAPEQTSIACSQGRENVLARASSCIYIDQTASNRQQTNPVVL